jgi:hypothetical protein
MSIFTGAANWNIQRTSWELVVGVLVDEGADAAGAGVAGAADEVGCARGEGGDWVFTLLFPG